jgi:DNA-binding transcriptional LysR family regulator/class 3 adenylate cyclase
VSESEFRHRLAAVLAADAAGYSRLMAADERATVVALDAARAVFRIHIEAHLGRVIDMAGDSVLAVFPTAAGAMSIQRELSASGYATPEDRRMRFRIGVHLGDLIEKPDGSVYGDGVNIAARLQALAEPGSTLVSGAVHGAMRGRIGADFIDRGEQTVKNIEHPVRAYTLVHAAPQAPAATVTLPRLPDKPSLAVLPFDNMSGDPEQEYFADGITEDIITDVSKISGLLVIARNSSFTYKRRSVDIREVGKNLGVPALAAFCRDYPEVEVELGVGNRRTDLVAEGVDCAIRAGELSEQLIVARRIGDFHFTTCATAAFLKRHGTPTTPSELAQRPTVGMISARTQRPLPFRYLDGASVSDVVLDHSLVVNDTITYVAAGVAGLGIIQAPTYAVHEALKDGRLVPVLQDRPTPTIPVHVLYAPNRYLSAKVRVFIDWVVALFERHEDLRRA